MDLRSIFIVLISGSSECLKVLIRFCDWFVISQDRTENKLNMRTNCEYRSNTFNLKGALIASDKILNKKWRTYIRIRP